MRRGMSVAARLTSSRAGLLAPTRSRRLRSDEGSISPIVPIMTIVILLLGGLTVDTGRQLDLRARAVAYAQEAARAGATQIEEGTTELRVNEPRAAQAVTTYCAEIERTGAVDRCTFEGLYLDPNDPQNQARIVVQVNVRMSKDATLLKMVGLQTIGATGTGRARPYEEEGLGITSNGE